MAGKAEAFQTTASASGPVSKIGIYVDTTSAATTLVAGLYAHAGDRPGALLGQGTLVFPIAGAWNEVSLPTPVNITSGTTYWIAILGPNGSGTLRFRSRCCGGANQPGETSQQLTLTTLPASWTRGRANRDGPASLYGASIDGPTLGVTPGSLAFSGAVGGADPAAQALSITNAGSGDLTWSVSDDAPWLTVAPTSGSAPATADVSASIAGLAPGNYSGTVTVTAPGAVGSPRSIGVTLSVAAAPDTTPPTVSLTAPGGGATVSGSVPVTADAADAGGVAGVQFRLDGAALGAEDTAAPYSVSWSTTTAANDAHTLTAVARDQAGNTATSDPVAVTVQNSGSPDQVGQWSALQDWPVVAVHSLLLPTGKVLVFDAFAQSPNSHRLWDPATGLFIPVPYDANLFCGGHTTLGDGRVIIVGGHITPYVGTRDTTIFDPQSSAWSRGADMFRSRWYPTATSLPDGRVLSISGDQITRGAPINRPYDSSATIPEIYDPIADSWTQLTGAARETRLYPFMFVLPDGRVIDAGPFAQSQFLDLGTNTWTPGPTSQIDGQSAVQYRPGRILKSGTAADPDFPNLTVTDRAVVLDATQASPAWREVGRMGSPRSYHTLTVLPDGNVLASGGGTRSDGADLSFAAKTAEIWDAGTESWTTMAAQQQGRLYHSSSLLLPDGRVLVAGGGRFSSAIVDQENAEIFSPPYLFKGPRPTISSAPSTAVYDSSFSVSTPDAADAQSVSLIRLGSTTHSIDQGQSFVPLTFTRGSGELMVRAPANPNIAPPGVYMMFIVDDQGVPSVASFVRLPVSQDTTAPTVELTTPAAGATVAGSVTLTADAADQVGVASVRFRVDGADIGQPDTTVPYSTSWNTLAGPDGPRTLTAVARDAAGNQTVSDPVTVTVENGVATGGPVAAYGFEETTGTGVTDSSGSGNAGTISGATRSTAGRFGRALSFDGVNDSVAVPDADSLDLTSGMTLEAWVYPTTGAGWRTAVLKEAPGYFRYALYAGTTAKRPSGRVFVGADQNADGTAALPTNTWSHLAATYDGTNLRLFVNGSPVATRPVSGPMASSANPLKIGGNSIWNEWFKGRIDEVRVYDRALSQAEVQADSTTPVVP